MNAAVLEDVPVRMRPMGERDVGAVIQIEGSVYDFPWSEGIFCDCLRVGYSCWVVESEFGVEGYGIMSLGAGESHILNLCIRADSQGRGLGRQLLMFLLDAARRRGAYTTLLEVRPSNRGALHLYESAGFSEVGVRNAYYPGKCGREDALVLAIDLDPQKWSGHR